MELIKNLFYGFPNLWGGGVTHSFLILALVITIGLALGKVKVRGVSLGMAWVLFIGILFGYLGFSLDGHVMHFFKEFGLVLFVYSIGMQAGPSFFSLFAKGGWSLHLLTVVVVLLAVVVTIVLHYTSGTPITVMAGILSGATTSTPGLGAVQQAWSYLSNGLDDPNISVGYSVAYPMGVIGTVLCFLLLRFVMRINKEREEEDAERGLGHLEDLTVRPFTVEVDNEMIEGKNIRTIREILNRKFVISRIIKKESNREEELVNGSTTIHHGDLVLIISGPADVEPIQTLLGKPVDRVWDENDGMLISRRVLVTRPGINGQTLSQLKVRSNLGASVTRINRAGVDLVATPTLKLQLGDKLTVVGTELAISHVEKLLGNQMKRLNYPNLIPIFLGIALGALLADLPIPIPGIATPVRLGLTGGPLVVAILIGYFGPKYHLVTYNTISGNLMIRQVGICLFLACVGIGAGKDFFATVPTMVGLQWFAYGLLITLIPLILGAVIGRYVLHLNFYTLLGVLSGANTNPPALSYASGLTSSDTPSVGYATVYPFAMFLHIIVIQVLVMALA